MPRYVIIGNGVAGTYAAKAIRSLDKDSEVTVFSSEGYPFYSRPRLPAYLAGEVDIQSLFVYPEKWYKENNINLVLNEAVQSVDSAKKEILLKSGKTCRYDKLLIANGSLPSFPPIAGLDNPWVFSLRTIEDANKITDYSREKKNVIVIGGGLLGLEAGNGLRKRGLKVKVVEFFDRLLPRQMDAEGSAILQKIFERMGFSFVLGAVTEKIYEEEGKRLIKLKDGRTFESDFVLVSAGIKPDTGLAGTTELKLNKGVVVDDYLKTSDDSIFSAGDVAEHNGKIYGIWPAAEEQGKIAGMNMTGEKEVYRGTVSLTTLKVVGIDLASLGETAVEGAKEYKRIDTKKNLYQKIFVKNEKIVGAILLGESKKVYPIQMMIKEKAGVKGYEEKVLLPEFDLKAIAL